MNPRTPDSSLIVHTSSFLDMPLHDPASWPGLLRQALTCYGEEMLRAVAGRLARPRGHWPAADLVERCLAASENAAVLDRRLRELSAGARRVLACMGHSRQPLWQLGNLVELA